MQASYIVNVELPEVRVEQIKSQARQATSTYPFPHYQNRVQPLPIVRLSIGLPIYRMANYRTRAEQLTYIREKNKPRDFFENGQENQSTQQKQHDILFTFAQKGSGGSVVPIADVLQESSQHEPILITSDGVVVNGNRRLSAMRELYNNGKEEFGHIDCMVLPEYATTDEIREIEVRLQMTPQTLLPYDWICEGIAINELIQMGMPKDKVSDLLRKRPVDLENHILALQHAELFLADRLGKPGDYAEILEKEQMFGDMAKGLKTKESDDLEASRHIAYILTENSGNLGRRVYDYKGAFGPDSKEVIESLARRLDVTLTPTPVEPDPQLIFEIDNEDENNNEAPMSYTPMIDILKDKSRSADLADEITDIYDAMRNARDDRTAGQHALRKVREANARLMEVDLTRADRGTYEAIRQQLESINRKVNDLQTQLARM
ncbi:hypothetical protein J7E73_07935 [Paenibacillus albidus]|uniref:hypothetical protein n=1 Tax=Paenibacillus albidus TaxID=2041023 RepID=UPI001BEBB4D4|nr:hypothetical protein [Paenibacillus albidus]MBT2289064.1 hypothetical protein [Paenibacillus albidus]